MGLTCCILQSKQIGNCSNKGLSSYHKNVVVVNLPGPIETDTQAELESAAAKYALVRLTRGPSGRLKAEPLRRPDKGCNGWMMGGCFIWTSDSRFDADYPIPLHDRQENPSS